MKKLGDIGAKAKKYPEYRQCYLFNERAKKSGLSEAKPIYIKMVLVITNSDSKILFASS